MTISITHPFVSAKGDGTDATLVRPSNWNAAHSTSMATLNLIGRLTAGVGAFEEIAITALIAAALNSADGISFLTAIGAGGFTTGDIKRTLKTTADSGWVMLDDGTIGSALSGASTRANADTLNLFTLIYNNLSDANSALLTSVGGATTRGAQGTAAAAFAANCRVSFPKTLGRAVVGAGTGSGLTARAFGTVYGSESSALSSTSQLPQFTPSGTINTGSVAFNAANISSASGGGIAITTGGFSATTSIPVGPPTFTGWSFTGNAIGSGSPSPFAIVQPIVALNAMVKL